MKTIKMKSISAGPSGVFHLGVSYKVDGKPLTEKMAESFVTGGYAEYEEAMLVKGKKETPGAVSGKLEADKKAAEEADKKSSPSPLQPPSSLQSKPAWGK